MLRNRYLTVFAILLSIVFSKNIFSAEAYSVSGQIFDEETKKPIPGASIRILNTTRGTYTSSTGKFRIPFLEGTAQLKVSSLGYESKTLDISPKHHDSLFVKLKPTAVLLSGVEKTAEIEATEIVKRAIERKADNLKILKTFKGTLYSKLVFEMGGSAFDAATGKDNSLMVSATIGKNKVDAKFQMFVLETFSNVMQDYEKKITRTNIIQRRQTSNMPASNNVLAIGNFINFYDDNMKFFNVDMITPLSKDALSYYKFKLLEKSVLDDRYIYVLEVLPNSALFPLFQGTMKIVEGTYNLIELDLKPSKGTAIAFLRDIELNQKFTEVQKNIWHPTFLEAKGKAKIEVVKGLFDLGMDVSATSIYSDVTVNTALPDSVYSTETARKTTVEKTADSAKPEFWEENSLREITPREIEMYKTVDSLVAKSDSIKANASDWDWGIMPAFDFNRVGSITAGITPSLTYKNIRLEGTGTFSFGLQKPLGEITLTVPIIDSGSIRLSAMGNVFSSIDILSDNRKQSRILNSVTSALFHQDYYDYFKAEGWNIFLNSRYRRFGVEGGIEFANHYDLSRATNRSIFSKDDWRLNPLIEPGNYRIGVLNLTYADFLRANQLGNIQSSVRINGLYGENQTKGNSFKYIQGSINFVIPLIATGYLPISLTMIAQGGLGSDSLPPQYQFRQWTTLAFGGGEGNFYSAPIGRYGGTEYFAGHLTLNLIDLWWRAIGLPLYEGRGLDLSLSASSGKFFTRAEKGYSATGKNFYSEVGFGFGKIPTFVSNVIFWSVDFRFGTGPIGAGHFGFGLGLTAPF